MEFITVEQFKEQSKEVQKVFLDWWKPRIGDIFIFNTDEYDNSDSNIGVLGSIKQINITRRSNGEYRIPLFTEGQLRRFIDDKESCLLDIKVENLHDNYNDYTVIGWEINRFEYGIEFGRILFEDCIKAKDLLQLYWKVACSVAKEV